MIEFRPCSACRRHVRVDADACPFCGAAPEAGPSRSLPRGRLTRAAVFAAGAALAGAAGCGGGEPATDDTNDQQTTGGDDGTGTGGDVMTDGDDSYDDDYEEPDHNIPMPYGAPPARDRLV